MGINIGIDLGTTNSVLAFANTKPNGDIVSKVVGVKRSVDMFNGADGGTKLKSEKKATLPSCVYYVEERGYAPIVGDFAKMQYSVRPHLVAKSIKSQMGAPYAENLSPDIPDKTPAQISAQILKHLLKDASTTLKSEIDDVIITVPANFDSAMCKATRDAAEIAGIKVKNPDGSEKPILLSEPNAVIYDLFNQINNGEIPSTVLDLSTNKKVMVFDLGGGTLDITMHEIKRRNNGSGETLKVDEIATNRYTLLGGDDFDELIAEEMFKRYLNQYTGYDEGIKNINRKKNEIMPQLRTFAEHLKIEVNESVDSGCDDAGSWFSDENDFPVGGNIHSTGLSYDDSFRKEEIEEILSVFMAEGISYSDYKRIDSITNTRNIIYPVLDVLNKAAAKLQTPDVTVDAVIVNGGMSKFYMVTDRLTKFFGFSPIVALDPDQSVARGAAVYHYLLNHNNEELKDDMKVIGDAESNVSEETHVQKSAVKKFFNFEMGNTILNDSLYLGMKNGVTEEIIPTGAELPYKSAVKKGFQIPPGQNAISFPIKSRNLNGSFRTIATGSIGLSSDCNKARYVAFQIEMDINKVITMNAWTYSGNNENNKLDSGIATILIDNGSVSSRKGPEKILPPSGSRLNPKAEIDSLIKLCQNFENNKFSRKNLAGRIKAAVEGICSAANRNEFASIIIRSLRECTCNEARMRLFIISRRIMSEWTDVERKSIADICMQQISGVLNQFPVYGTKKSVNIQSIYTLAFCGSDDQFEKLMKIHNNPDYYQACLYAHAVSKTDTEWLAEQFKQDVRSLENNANNSLQSTAYSIGLALNGNVHPALSAKEIRLIIRKLNRVIESGDLSVEQFINCILSLGWICDCRCNDNLYVTDDVLREIKDMLSEVRFTYDSIYMQKSEKVRSVVLKLIEGNQLDEDEEHFLLEKIAI